MTTWTDGVGCMISFDRSMYVSRRTWGVAELVSRQVGGTSVFTGYTALRHV